MGLRGSIIFAAAMVMIILLSFHQMILGLKVDQLGQGLSYEFYEETCPQVEDIVRAAVQSLSLTDPASSSALLRLTFHDCQVQGCDASILIDLDFETREPMEMASSKNFGIRKRETIGLIKTMVEAVCPRQVSCADILIMAAREAVAMSGGPHINVPLGRRDSTTTPSRKLADANLPQASLDVDGTIRLFASKGMTIEETVAIMGAHTLGVTHCFNIVSRLNEGDVADEMAPGFKMLMRLSCPLGSLTPNTTFVVNDPTALIFDNQYYVNAIGGRGILRVDSELPLDPRTAPYVERFAVDQDEFFRALSSAFIKLSSFGVLTGNHGAMIDGTTGIEHCTLLATGFTFSFFFNFSMIFTNINFSWSKRS